MKYKFIYLMIAFSSLIFQSCEEVIELDVPEGEKRIVVEGLLTNQDTSHFIKLSLTSDYFDYNPAPRVSGAIVAVLTNEPDTILYTEKEIGSGLYYSDYMAKEDVEYRLFIQTPNGKQYTSEPEYLNRVPPIDSIYQNDELFDSTGFFDKGYYVYFSTTEPAGMGDYYRWIIYVNDQKLIEPFSLWIETDQFVDGNEIIDFRRVYGLLPGDKIEFFQMSISERAYHYWFLLREQISIFGSPFDSPPSPIEGNIRCTTVPDEEVFGFFGVSKVERKAYIIEQR